jgi:RND family efflux transporter MFP subunit
MNIGVSRKVLARGLVLPGILCVIAACREQADVPQTAGPEVDVMTLQPQSIMLSTEVAGHTSASQQAEVRPQVSGTILERRFEEGTNVKAGQVLYQIDPQTYQLAFNSAKAGLSLAEAQVARLRARQDGTADAEYKWALEDVVKTRAALDKARTDLAATRIAAPISGRIGISTVTSGNVVGAGQPSALATISQIDPICVDVTMSSIAVLHTSALAQAGLRLSDGVEYAHAGKLEFPKAPPAAGTGSVIVRAVFPNPDGELLPGMAVRVQVEEGVRDESLLVPQRGVIRDTTGQATVLVVGSDNRVEVRSVTIERVVGDQWLIGAGLQAGERIVIAGFQHVRPGITVTPVPSRANTPKAAPKPGGLVARR